MTYRKARKPQIPVFLYEYDFFLLNICVIFVYLANVAQIAHEQLQSQDIKPPNIPLVLFTGCVFLHDSSWSVVRTEKHLEVQVSHITCMEMNT